MMIEYQEKVNLRVNDFDCHDRLLISSILDLFQDVAGKHATKLKVGFHDLLKLNRIWVVVRTKVEIYSQPKVEETVIIRTYPLPLGKIDANRCYEILNEQGKVLVKGISKWVNVDLTSRRVVRLNDITYGEGILYQEDKMTEDFNKTQDFVSESEIIKVKPMYLDLDHNGHINNSKYINFILNNVKELQDKEIVFCPIDYVQELQKDEEFNFSYKVDANDIYSKGEIKNSLRFISKITIK